MAEPGTAQQLTCCPLTPSGVGAIAVVALRGGDAWGVVRDCVASPRGALPATCQPSQLYFGVFRDENEAIDDVILAPQFESPERLAGVDISSHGGIRVVERILMALTARGAQVVSADAIQSSGDWRERIKSQALQRMNRMTTRRSVTFLLTQSESLPSAYARILDHAQRGDESTARKELTAIIERSRKARHFFGPAEISFIGPPNAGKSSLVNALSGRDNIVVTDRAGTTRDWVNVSAAIMGVEVTLIDTAGLHDAPGKLEDIAIARGQTKTHESDLRIWVFDGSKALPDIDPLSFRKCEQDLVVYNKSDLVGDSSQPCTADSGKEKRLSISALSGDGVDELRAVIGTRLGLDQIDESLPTEFDPARIDRASELLDSGADSATSLAAAIRRLLLLG